MRRAGNLDPNAIGPVRRDQRAVAQTPCREPREPFVVLFGRRFGDMEFGHERLRVRDREAGAQASVKAVLSAAAIIRRGPTFIAVTSCLSRGGASLAFLR